MALKGVSFILMPFYLRTFTQEDFGLMELALSLAGFIGVLTSAGLPQMYFVNHFHLDEKHQVTLLYNTTKMYLVSLCLMTLLYFFFSQTHTFKNLFPSSISWAIWGIAALSFFQQILFNTLQIREEVFKVSILQIGLGAFQLITNAFFVFYLNYGITTLFITNFMALAISTMLYFIFIRKLAIKTMASIDNSNLLTVAKKRLPEAATLLGGQISYFAQTQIDRWIILSFIGISSVGIYSVAVRITAVFGLVIVAPFITSYTPNILIRYSEDDIIATDTQNRTTSYMILLLGSLIMLLLFFTLKRPFILFVGESYKDAYTPLFLLLGAQIFFIAEQVRNCLLVHLKKLKTQTIGVWITVLFNLTLNLFLVQTIGLIGAALATLGGYVIWFIYTDIACRVVIRKERSQ